MDEPTGIDQLLRVDWVTMGFENLLLEFSDGVFTVSVDLRAHYTETSYCTGRTHLEDLLLQCLNRYLHYGTGQTRDTLAT